VDIPKEVMKDLATQHQEVLKQLKTTAFGRLGYELEVRGSDEIKQTILADGDPVVTVGMVRIDERSFWFGVRYPKELENIPSIAGPSFVLHPGTFDLQCQAGDPREVVAKPVRSFSLAVAKMIVDSIKKTYYISALRGNVKRTAPADASPEWVGTNGELTLELLALIAGNRKYGKIWIDIEKWAGNLGLSDLGAGWRGGGQLGSEFNDPDFGNTLNISSAGQGSKQILPVIVQLFYSPKDSVIMVEEPEISLHPDAQVKLPEMFLDAMRKGNRQVVVTTHSESLLLALKPVIARGDLRNDEVAVYHFRKSKEGISVKRLELTTEGLIKGWVPSFADVENKLLKEWIHQLPEE
jgi:hypothetical protein